MTSPRRRAANDASANALVECEIACADPSIRTTACKPGPYRTIGDVEYAAAGWAAWYHQRCRHNGRGCMTAAQ